MYLLPPSILLASSRGLDELMALEEPLSPLGKPTVLGLLGGATVPVLPPWGLPVSCCARGLPGAQVWRLWASCSV